MSHLRRERVGVTMAQPFDAAIYENTDTIHDVLNMVLSLYRESLDGYNMTP